MVAACGFTPLDAPGRAGLDLSGRVAIAPIDSRDGFIFIGRIEELLGRPVLPEWQLSAALEIAKEAMAVTTQNEIDRFNLLGRADWRLVDLETGDLAASGTARDFTAYSATASTIATLSAERDAFRRLARSLADAVVTDLSLTLAAQ